MAQRKSGSTFGFKILAAATLLLGLAAGCASSKPVDVSWMTPTTAQAQHLEDAGLGPVRWVPPVEAAAPVPLGWTAEPLKVQPKSKHQIWISPSGSTAFGVLNVQHFLLPLASDERVMDEFLKGMKETEGEAKLLEGPSEDPQLGGGIGGLRFVAEGGKYKVRANLVSRGTRAWIYYAGTLRGEPFDPAELAQAEEARDRTVVGLTEPPKTLPGPAKIAGGRAAGGPVASGEVQFVPGDTVRGRTTAARRRG